MQYFNIQVASQLSGVASATIRAWEKRYNAVVPERADNKHRLYSEKDIEKLALLYRLTEFGKSIGKIAHLNLEQLKEAYSTLMHKPYDELEIVTPHHERVDTDKILGNLFIALEAYKLDIISHELEKARSMLSPRELCLTLLLPLLTQTNERVANGELSIAQEHIVTEMCSFYIGQIIEQNYQKKAAVDDLILIGTPENEFHEIGILASALLCVHYGIRFIFLGTNLRTAPLAEAANTLKPKVMLLGTMQGQGHLENYINELSAQLKTSPEIWIGGHVQSLLKYEFERRKVLFFSALQDLDKHLQSFSMH